MMASMEIEPEKIRPQYKVHKILASEVKSLGRSGFRKQFLGLSLYFVSVVHF